MRTSAVIDAINVAIGRLAAWALVASIVISAGNAVSRRVLGVSSNAWLEIQWYLFGAAFMLCAAWVLRDNAHVRIDAVSSHFSHRTRAKIELLGHVFFLFPFVALMIWLSVPFFLKALSSGEISPNSGGLALWPAKGLIMLGFILLGLQWFSELIKSVAMLNSVEK